MNDGITDLVSSKRLTNNGCCFDEYVLLKNPFAVALTIEVGSILESQEVINQQTKKVLEEFLLAITAIKVKKNVVIWEQKQYVKNTTSHSLLNGFINFQEIKKGTMLTSSKETSQFEGVILFPKYTHTTDSFIARIATRKNT